MRWLALLALTVGCGNSTQDDVNHAGGQLFNTIAQWWFPSVPGTRYTTTGNIDGGLTTRTPSSVASAAAPRRSPRTES